MSRVSVAGYFPLWNRCHFPEPKSDKIKIACVSNGVIWWLAHWHPSPCKTINHSNSHKKNHSIRSANAHCLRLHGINDEFDWSAWELRTKRILIKNQYSSDSFPFQTQSMKATKSPSEELTLTNKVAVHPADFAENVQYVYGENRLLHERRDVEC